MNAKEYSRLSEAIASLSIALCAMDEKNNDGFVYPKETAKAQVLKAYLLIDKMLIKKANYDKQ